MKRTLAAGLIALSTIFDASAQGQESIQDLYDQMNVAATIRYNHQKFVPITIIDSPNAEKAGEDISQYLTGGPDLGVKISADILYRAATSAPFSIQVLQNNGIVNTGIECLTYVQTSGLTPEINNFFGFYAFESQSFHFDVPDDITRQAWQVFKTHFAAGLCLKPNFQAYPPSKGIYEFNSNMEAIVFAAVMSARAGYPQLIPFIADLYAATFLKASLYPGINNNFLKRQLPDGAWNLSATTREGMTYPSFALDALAKEWASDNSVWKSLEPEKIYTAVEDFTDKHRFSFYQYWTLVAMRGYYQFHEQTANQSEFFAQSMERRAAEGVERLHVCLMLENNFKPAPYFSKTGVPRWLLASCAKQASLNGPQIKPL